MASSRRKGKSTPQASQQLGVYDVIKGQVKDAQRQIRELNKLESQIRSLERSQNELGQMRNISGLSAGGLLIAGALGVGITAVLPAVLIMGAIAGITHFGRELQAGKKTKVEYQRDAQEERVDNALAKVDETRGIAGEALQNADANSGNWLTRRIGFKAHERAQNHEDAKELRKELVKTNKHVGRKLGM